MQLGALAEGEQVDADGGDVLADLAGLDVALVEDLLGDEVHLAEVGGRRGDVEAAAVLDVWGLSCK